MRATISLLRNGFEEEAVTFGYPRERVFRQVARVRCVSRTFSYWREGSAARHAPRRRNRCVAQALKPRNIRTSQGAQVMSARVVSRAVVCVLMMVGVFSPAYALTQQELVAKLEAAGYSQIRDIKSSAEGTAVKAMKNGKEVSLVVDSSGQIQERR